MLNNYKINNINEIVGIGKKIVPDCFVSRFDEIDKYNMLYENDREKIYKLYLNEMYKYDIFKKANYNPMMLTPNYCSQSTKALIKYTMSENPIYSVSSKDIEYTNILNKYVKHFEFNEKIKEIIEKIDVSGNCFVRIVPSAVLKNYYTLQILNTEQVYVVSDIITDETTAYITYSILSQDDENNYYARILVAEYGKNTYYDARISSGIITDLKFLKSEKTNFEGFSIFNFLVNRDFNNKNYGVSSYRELMPLQSNYIVGINMIMTIVSRYSAPTLAGPPLTSPAGREVAAGGVNIPNIPIPQTKINTGAAVAGAPAVDAGHSVQSLAGKYLNIQNKDDIIPAYIEYDAKLQQQMDFYAKFIRNDIGNFSAFPEIVKDEETWGANITSGKALKLKNMSAIDKATLYTNTIKDKLCDILQILTGINDKIIINFQDGIVDFEDEQLAYASGRLANGTFSKADAIQYLDGLTKEEAEKKVEEILKSQNNNINNNTKTEE